MYLITLYLSTGEMYSSTINLNEVSVLYSTFHATTWNPSPGSQPYIFASYKNTNNLTKLYSIPDISNPSNFGNVEMFNMSQPN